MPSGLRRLEGSGPELAVEVVLDVECGPNKAHLYLSMLLVIMN